MYKRVSFESRLKLFFPKLIFAFCSALNALCYKILITLFSLLSSSLIAFVLRFLRISFKCSETTAQSATVQLFMPDMVLRNFTACAVCNSLPSWPPAARVNKRKVLRLNTPNHTQNIS
jgi:hypothetical protein